MNHLKFWNWHFFHNFTWDAGATLLAAAIAGLAVLLGFFVNSAQSRRQRRSQVYADALQAVSDYLEGPYRVARCHDSDEQRFALTSEMSAIQGRIDALGLLLSLHAPRAVVAAFDEYVSAARQEAGVQMAEQWKKRPAKRHKDMNMSSKFPQPRSVAAKKKLVAAMQADMAAHWYKPWTWLRG